MVENNNLIHLQVEEDKCASQSHERVYQYV